MGAPISHIVRGPVREKGVRFIAGGIFRGYTISPASYLGLYETAVTVLPAGDEKEFLGFARPGFGKPSHSRTFLSAFNTAPLKMDCTLHGEERACINCGYCADVCPVDILPQFTLKSILAGEVEDSLAHGLLDCVACGLCTYVCPSKIALCDALTAAKRAYYQELV
jgi:Na+-transporting NADH:ubiquinone oxidoreductase subunit A